MINIQMKTEFCPHCLLFETRLLSARHAFMKKSIHEGFLWLYSTFMHQGLAGGLQLCCLMRGSSFELEAVEYPRSCVLGPGMFVAAGQPFPLKAQP